MAQRSSQSIPASYRVFFTSIDPLIALSGAYMDYFDAKTLLSSYFPASHPWSKVLPSHTVLLHQAGGAFVMMAFLMVFMLRYTQDANIWKMFEFGILITDFTLFYSLWKGLEAQQRLQLESVRWEEWVTIAVTGFVTVVRTLFLLGVGFSKTAGGAKKKA